MRRPIHGSLQTGKFPPDNDHDHRAEYSDVHVQYDVFLEAIAVLFEEAAMSTS